MMFRSLSKISAAFLLLVSPCIFGEDLSKLIPPGSTPEKAVEILLADEDTGEDAYRIRLIAAAEIRQITGELVEAADLFKKASLAVKGSKDFYSLYRAALIRVETADYRSAEADIRAITTFSDDIALRVKANVLLSRIRAHQDRKAEAVSIMAGMLAGDVELSFEAYIWAQELAGSGFSGAEFEAFRALVAEHGKAGKAGYELNPIPTPGSVFGLTGIPDIGTEDSISVSVTAVESSNDTGAAPEAEPEAEPESETYIQIGSFTRIENAEDLKKTVGEFGFKAEISSKTVNGTEYNVVLISAGGEGVQSVIIKLKEKGFEGYPLY